jgi:hypothetical protein
MNGSQQIGLVLITLGFAGFIALILYRRSHRQPASATPVFSAAPLMEAPILSEPGDPVVRALRAEMSSLKLYLFFLPFIWSVIWGLLYLALR